jgi:hypothetical protein
MDFILRHFVWIITRNYYLCLHNRLCYSIFSFICMVCRSLFVLLYFFFWPLCCLFFFDIRFLITPLVSSNSSCNDLLLYNYLRFALKNIHAHKCSLFFKDILRLPIFLEIYLPVCSKLNIYRCFCWHLPGSVFLLNV